MSIAARVSALVTAVALWLLGSALQAQVDTRGEEFFVKRGGRTFRTFCASCHGLDGEGDGPVAEDLKIPPPDLTQISSRRGSAFPEEWIHEVIDGRARLRGHGTEEMPVWGDVFQSPVMNGGGRPIAQGPALARQRIDEVVLFLREIQEVGDEVGEEPEEEDR